MVENNHNSLLTVDWAELADLLAKEYGWTLSDIGKLTLPQVLKLVRAIEQRYKRQKEAIDKGTPTEASNETNIKNLALKLGGKIKKTKDGKEEIVI